MSLFKSFVFFFIISLIAGFTAVAVGRWWYVRYIVNVPFQPSYDELRLKPPATALTGVITRSSGYVIKHSRSGTETQVFGEDYLLQGESLQVDATSSAAVTFPESSLVSLGTRADIDLIAAIPDQLLFEQHAGLATYTASDSAHPLSVRVQHLLVTVASGSATLDFIQNPGYIRISATEPVSVGFQDKNLNTLVMSIAAGKTYLYSDSKRQIKELVVRPRPTPNPKRSVVRK